MIDKDSSLAKASRSLMMTEPYYGLFLMQLMKEWTDKIPSAGVGKNGINVKMFINEMFWESLTDLWRMMILKHNVLNVVFHHLEMWDELEDKEVMSLASSICCNEFIDPAWLPLHEVKYADFVDLHRELYELWKRDIEFKRKTKEEVIEEMRKIPPRGVYREDFHELKLEPKQGLKYYYDKLIQAKDKQPGKGGCRALNELLQDKHEGLPEGWSKDWSDFEGMSDAQKKLLTSQLDHLMKEVAEQVKKSRGTIPSELAGYLEGLDKSEPPKFDWRRYLRRFVGGSANTYTKMSRRKENCRFPDSPGIESIPKAKIMVAVDTSGSVSDKELKEFFHEIYHMYKMGTEVVVVQCDAAISSIEKYKRGMEDKIKVTGRGGTSFDPPCDYYNEHKKDFCCMIYLTDGACPPPINKPKGRHLWVLSTRASENNQLQPQIKLN